MTVTTKSLDELLLIFDGIHRIAEGQQPGIDFRSAYGPLTSYASALAYSLTGRYGLAMPLALGLFTIVMTLVGSHVLGTRLRGFLAVSFTAFLLLILAAPMSLGDPVTSLSFARFDIRIAWVALALMLVLYLRPYDHFRRTQTLDVICATLLTLILIYTGLTYAAVAISLLLLMMTDRRQWRISALSLASTAVVVAVIHVAWNGSGAYFQAAFQALKAQGVAGGSLWDLLQRALVHLTDFLLLGILAGILLWFSPRPRHLVFFLLSALGGLLIISHNLQPWGIISMHAAAVVAAELILRRMDRLPASAQGQIVNASGVKLFFLAFVLPTSLHCGTALALHAGTASLRAGTQLSLPQIDGVYLADLWTGGDYRNQAWYLGLVGQGLDLLGRSDQSPGRILTIGEVNVFPTLLNLPAPPRQVTDMRWNTLRAQEPAIDPAQLLADSDSVLFRKTGDNADGLQQRILTLLRGAYTEAGESEHWILFRRDAPAAPGPGSE